MSPAEHFFLVPLAVGLVFIAVGLVAFYLTRAFVTKAARAEATVVSEEQPFKHSDGTPSGQTATFWYGEFLDKKGLRQRLHLGVSMQLGPLATSSGKVPPAGSKLSVLFNPENPLQVRRDSFKELWGVALVCAAVGIACVLLALVVWALGR